MEGLQERNSRFSELAILPVQKYRHGIKCCGRSSKKMQKEHMHNFVVDRGSCNFCAIRNPQSFYRKMNEVTGQVEDEEKRKKA